MNKRNGAGAHRAEFCGVLAADLIILKISGAIRWSWPWVLAPIWIPAALVLGAMLVHVAGTAVLEIRERRTGK